MNDMRVLINLLETENEDFDRDLYNTVSAVVLENTNLLELNGTFYVIDQKIPTQIGDFYALRISMGPVLGPFGKKIYEALNRYNTLIKREGTIGRQDVIANIYHDASNAIKEATIVYEKIFRNKINNQISEKMLSKPLLDSGITLIKIETDLPTQLISLQAKPDYELTIRKEYVVLNFVLQVKA